MGRFLGMITAAVVACAALPVLTPVWAAAPVDITGTLDTATDGPVIHRQVYGQFVEHLGRGVCEGIWVGKDSPIPNTRGIRNDVVAALKAIKAPVIRWPGGCFADDYHWRDGAGPERKATINSNWARQPEPNTFGTHEFMDFVGQVGAEPYISVNMGSGSVAEAQGWLQYMTAPASTGPGAERAKNGQETPWTVPYVGVGNETWGCGGNMFPEEYADQFRHYAAYMKSASGPRPQLIAVGPDTDDYEWTETVMKRATMWRANPTPLMYATERPLMDALALHFYTLPTNKWDKKGIDTGFDEAAWISTMKRALLMDELLQKHSAIMDKYDPKKKVALIVDEWGTWYDAPKGTSGLWQQNTLRDALVAAVTLNVFHDHAERVKMANIAQMANVLQAMFLTDKERLVLTPTYHVFGMYVVHQDATRLPLTLKAPEYRLGEVSVPSVTATASHDKGGKVHVSLANLDPNRPARLTLAIPGVKTGKVTGQILTAPQMDSYNDFAAPARVAPQAFTGARLQGTTLTVELPAKSVVTLELP